MKRLLFILPLFLLACGPSKEELEARYIAQADSLRADSVIKAMDKAIDAVTVVETDDDKPSYYSAAELGVIAGEVEMFAPDEDVIDTWRSAGGDIPDGKIYIQIKGETGKITIMECDYKTWVNIPVGSILK